MQKNPFLVCLVALHREGTKIMVVQEFDLAAIAATICSLARLVYDTYQNYRVNGAWICFNLIMVNSYCCLCFLACQVVSNHTCVDRFRGLRSFSCMSLEYVRRRVLSNKS